MQAAWHALRAVPVLAAADDDELERLAAQTFPRRLAKGQVLFTQGDRSEHLYVVSSGRIKVLVTSPHGNELVLSVLSAGDALGELSILDGADRSADAVALDDVRLWCVAAPAVRELLQRSPAVALAVAEELAGRVRQLTGTAADLVFLDLSRRLAKLLASGDAAGAAGLTQSDVAAQLGVARQSLNRALQRLQDRGWIEVQRGRITVVDGPALTRFAQS